MPHVVRSWVVLGSIVCALAGCTAPAPEAAAQPLPAVEVPKPVEAPKAPAPEVLAPKPAPPELTAPPAETVTLETKVGVAACDDFAARYRACLEKVPDVERDTHEQVAVAQLQAWTRAKVDPKLAPALAGECEAAAVAARAMTRVFGCVWREGDRPEPEAPKGGKAKSRGVERSLDPLRE